MVFPIFRVGVDFDQFFVGVRLLDEIPTLPI